MADRIKNRKSKTIKTDAFELAINKIANMDGFNAELIIECFRADKIRSSDFSLDGFKTRQDFVVDFFATRHKISKEDKVGKGKLIKLYQGLNNKYRITKPCIEMNINHEYPNIWSSGSLVFISPKYTEEIINNDLILECETLDTSRRLYQYLNWTIRVNKINKYINCFVTKNNIKFLVINSELHDKNGNELYIFCIANDIISDKAQKWQFVKLLTAEQLMQFIVDPVLDDIISNFVGSVTSVVSSKITSIIGQFTGRVLPKGARKSGNQFRRFTLQNVDKQTILRDNLSYSQLKGIQTGYDKKKGIRKEKLEISLQEFEQCIREAVDSNDARHNLIPIVSILSGKKYGDGDYSVDQVLPVNIYNHWVGICYRNGKPVMVLFDGYDITNKAILCKPDFDKDKLAFFTNNISKIVITNNRRNNNSYQPRSRGRQSPSSSPSIHSTPSTPSAPSTFNTSSYYGGYNQCEESGYDSSSYSYPYYGYYSTSTSASTPMSTPMSAPISTPLSTPISTPMSSPAKVNGAEYKCNETQTTDPTVTNKIGNYILTSGGKSVTTPTATTATTAPTETNKLGQEGNNTTTSYGATNNVLTEGYCGNQTTLIASANLYNYVGGYIYTPCNTTTNINNNNNNNTHTLSTLNSLNSFGVSCEGLQTLINLNVQRYQQEAQYFQQFTATPTAYVNVNVNSSCLIQEQQQQTLYTEQMNVEQMNETKCLDATSPEFVPSKSKKNKFVSDLTMIKEGEAI